MALTRKFLSALGIEAEKIDEIITAHQETLADVKAERDKYKEDADKLPDIQKELNDLKTAQGADTPYKEKYEKEHKDFEDYKAGVLAKETKAKKNAAVKNLFKDAGMAEKYLDAVLKIYDVDSVEIDKDGNIKDADNIKTAVKEQYPEFIQTQGIKGADNSTPPKGTGANDKKTSRAAQVAAKYYENIYGAAKEE